MSPVTVQPNANQSPPPLLFHSTTLVRNKCIGKEREWLIHMVGSAEDDHVLTHDAGLRNENTICLTEWNVAWAGVMGTGDLDLWVLNKTSRHWNYEIHLRVCFPHMHLNDLFEISYIYLHLVLSKFEAICLRLTTEVILETVWFKAQMTPTAVFP